MATHDVYRPNVNYTLATQVAPTLDVGKVAFVPFMSLASANGTAMGTVSNPVVVSTSSGAGAANLATGQATVATTAGGTQIVAARAGRSSVTITNLGTTDVFVGNSGLTTATGQLLTGTKGASITINTSAAVFGIVGTGSQAVSFIESY